MLANTFPAVTCSTKHITTNDFVDAVDAAAPGSAIVYALGDLAMSAPYGGELIGLRSIVWRYHTEGRGHLTQRRRPDVKLGKDAAFEYIFTTAAPPWHGRVGRH